MWQIKKPWTLNLENWWNGRFASWMCSHQICRNCVMLSRQYGPKSLRNVSNTLLNLCHEELRQFWRQKGVQPGTSKVHLIKWPVSVSAVNRILNIRLKMRKHHHAWDVYIYICIYVHTHTHTYIYTVYIYIYIYIYIYKERQRELILFCILLMLFLFYLILLKLIVHISIYRYIDLSSVSISKNKLQAKTVQEYLALFETCCP